MKVADALADGKAIKENNAGVPYYNITRGSRDIIVACAVGHLYGLAQTEGKKGEFPVFNIEWQASHLSRKGAAFTKKYLNTLIKLAKGADEFTIATDYDVEGEVIGWNVVRFACKQKDANRMKFSTLLKEDLQEAYEHKTNHLNWGQAKAGETRHKLDWFHGINFSRALTHAVKSTGAFKLMSTGRVQGPALKIVVDREKEIKAFKPDPFWQIQLLGTVNKGNLEAWHVADKFWEKTKADAVMEKVANKTEGTVTDLKKKQFNQSPPTPFDLTTLQTESYRCFGIQPKDTLAIAQELYSSGFISYPRTSSQQLTPKIGFSKILSLLGNQPAYAPLTKKLLLTDLNPNNGKKTDPAHPAIYPTGLMPNVGGREARVYDLIARRFMATFGTPALRETNTITITVSDENFNAKGTRTVEKGWHLYYGAYVKIEEIELPAVKKEDSVKIKEINQLAKETQPPKRYTPASIIKELEKRGLGTKATRSSIVDTLFQRGYVMGKAIEATELGIRTMNTLEKYVPEIVDEALTKKFEEEMEKISADEVKPEKILDDAESHIKTIVTNFKKNEKDIGKELMVAEVETRDKLTTLGDCINCKTGKLQIRRGKYGAFIACNGYPECKTTISLPRDALLKPAGKKCEHCEYPLILKIMRKKRPQEFCINKDCKSKEIEGDAGKEAQDIESGKVERKCEKCNKGKLVVRKSLYGSFLGCSKYPKCKFTEKLEEDKSKETTED